MSGNPSILTAPHTETELSNPAFSSFELLRPVHDLALSLLRRLRRASLNRRRIGHPSRIRKGHRHPRWPNFYVDAFVDLHFQVMLARCVASGASRLHNVSFPQHR